MPTTDQQETTRLREQLGVSPLGEMEIKISGSMVGYTEYFQGNDTVFVID